VNDLKKHVENLCESALVVRLSCRRKEQRKTLPVLKVLEEALHRAHYTATDPNVALCLTGLNFHLVVKFSSRKTSDEVKKHPGVYLYK
jgi:hypothetical protein